MSASTRGNAALYWLLGAAVVGAVGSAVVFLATLNVVMVMSYIVCLAAILVALVRLATRATWSRFSRPHTVLLAGVAAFALLLAAVPSLMQPHTTLNEIQMITWPHRFSASAWRTHPHQRWAMADDLATGTELRCKTLPQVLALLGEPAADLQGFAYVTPSPQRPGDELILYFDKGRVDGWSLTSDDLMPPEYR